MTTDQTWPRLSLDYVSTSCNRQAHCLDWGRQLVCLACKFAVAIYDVQETKIVNLLVGHSAQVNCVRWLGNNQHDDLIASCSSDKTTIIWQRVDSVNFIVKHKLIGHLEPVIVVDAVFGTDDKILTVSCSLDKTCRVWNQENQVAQVSFKSFIFDTKIIIDSMFANIIIAFAGSDQIIYLYALKEQELETLIELRGHEDWIRSIDFICRNGTMMLASSSQDCFIRVHAIEKTEKEEPAINEKFFNLTCNYKNTFKYRVKLETILSGHENWVYEVRWIKECKCLKLLSASMDKTMILWQQPDVEDELWLEEVRVGEVGGDALGFLGCCASFDGTSIIGYSFNGSLHFWKNLDHKWIKSIIVSGHFDEVTDISWGIKGYYLLSTSLDQTTRLHSVWNKSASQCTWHEIARPQIHGYELNCISTINSFTFVCGAEEKVLRIFKATKCFLESLKNISGIDLSNQDEELAHCATVPTLGLSNRAIFEQNQVESSFKDSILEEPPTEDVLMQNTLWPEMQKLYGHGYEIFAVASSHSGTLIASACKATKPEHANVILWSVKDSKQIQQLYSHQLTITQIRFSYDDKFILTVSRDRTWSLFRLLNENLFMYEKVAFSDKKNGIHSRIIWDCSWTSDDCFFITASRDKTAVIWFVDKTKLRTDENSSLGIVKTYGEVLTLSDPITSVDTANTLLNNQSYLVAFGLESGKLCLYQWNGETFWTLLTDIFNCHHLSIKRVRFCPEKNENEKKVKLATCGSDCIIKIYTIFV